MQESPLITYITVVRNGSSLIETTIRSIIKHVNKDIEYVIVDGLSGDGTVDIIRKYSSKCRYISEPDLGIYDAMNKGVTMANGTYISFINLGDALIYPPVKELQAIENAEENTKAVAFSVKLSFGQVFKPRFSTFIKIRNTLHHQGLYLKKRNNMPYNLNFPVFADFDLNQKLFKKGEQVLLMPDIVVAFHDVSGVSNQKANFRESLRVVRTNFGMTYMALSYMYFRWNGLIGRIKRIVGK